MRHLILIIFLIPLVTYSQLEEDVVNSYFQSSGTGPSDAGKWTRIASATIVSAYQDYATEFKILGNGGGNSIFCYGNLVVRIKRQSATVGTPTHYSIVLFDSNMGSENIKGVVSGSTVDIYAKINTSYTRLYFRRTSRGASLVSGVSDDGFISTLPAGDFQINCEDFIYEKLQVNGNASIIGDIIMDYGKSLKIDTDWGGTGEDKILQTGWDSGRDDYLDFYVPGSQSVGQTPRLSLNQDGNVGIGTTIPTHKLEVNGTIRSKEVKVEATPWPDYVFEEDYELRSLEETEAFIKKYKHLPEIPSAKEIEASGLELGEMNRLLLQKVEELTLHLIESNKNNSRLEAKAAAMEQQISEQQKLQKLQLLQVEALKQRLTTLENRSSK